MSIWDRHWIKACSSGRSGTHVHNARLRYGRPNNLAEGRILWECSHAHAERWEALACAEQALNALMEVGWVDPYPNREQLHESYTRFGIVREEN